MNTNTNNKIQNDSRNVNSRYGHTNTNHDNHRDNSNDSNQYGNTHSNVQHETQNDTHNQTNTNMNNEIQNGSQNTDSLYVPQNVNNDPAWMCTNNDNTSNMSPRRDDRSKKSRIFVYAARVFAAHTHQQLRHMPLDLDNGLPAIDMRFGLDDMTETCFACYVDSCAAMKTGNLLIHQWIMTTYPAIVCSYEQFND